MKYRITKKGKELFPDANTAIDWDDLTFSTGFIINKETALELGLFEEVPKRIELMLNSDAHIYRKGPMSLFPSDTKMLEHCINGEWDQIPENLEWIEKMHEFYLNSSDFDNPSFIKYLKDQFKK